MYTVGIITSSDKGYAGEREDKSGEIIKELVEAAGFTVVKQVILPDDRKMLANEFKVMSDELKVNLVLSTGGTGFSKRDITPEATRDIIEREAPGICEAIRMYSMQITKRAMLSRAVLDDIKHGIDILLGTSKDCARK